MFVQPTMNLPTSIKQKRSLALDKFNMYRRNKVDNVDNLNHNYEYASSGEDDDENDINGERACTDDDDDGGDNHGDLHRDSMYTNKPFANGASKRSHKKIMIDMVDTKSQEKN